MLVAACKEAQGAHLDLVQEQLYDSHLRAVAAQVSYFVGWLPAAARWGLHAFSDTKPADVDMLLSDLLHPLSM